MRINSGRPRTASKSVPRCHLFNVEPVFNEEKDSNDVLGSKVSHVYLQKKLRQIPAD